MDSGMMMNEEDLHRLAQKFLVAPVRRVNFAKEIGDIFYNNYPIGKITLYLPQKEPSLYCVKAIAILDNDGNRLLAKYYDDQFPSAKEQKVFEKNLFNKTHRANAEIIMFEGLTCVYRSNVDLFFYVVGSSNENELILGSVLNGFYEAVSQILRRNVEKRALLENLDAIFLAVDEICDGGIILDCDSSSIVSKVAIRSEDIPIGEQTVQQVLQTAKEQIKWSLLK